MIVFGVNEISLLVQVFDKDIVKNIRFFTFSLKVINHRMQSEYRCRSLSHRSWKLLHFFAGPNVVIWLSMSRGGDAKERAVRGSSARPRA